MKRRSWIPFLMLISILPGACKETGKTAFRDEGCAVCHMEKSGSIGPSLESIAIVYQANGGGDRLRSFLERRADPILDPATFESMEPNLIYSSRWEEEKKRKIVEYILSFATQ